MHQILQKLDDCKGRLSELLINSVTDESDTNSLIKPAYQENSDEIVDLSRTRKRTMCSKMLTETINDIKIKLGCNSMERKIGKAKMAWCKAMVDRRASPRAQTCQLYRPFYWQN